MTDQDLIQSGNLEAYVCGVLSDEESTEISLQLKGNKVLREEVEKIENCYIKLAEGVAPETDEHKIFDKLLKTLDANKKTHNKGSFVPYLGWAAAIALLLVCGYLYTSVNEFSGINDNLGKQISNIEQDKEFLESEITDLETKNSSYQEAIAFIREPETVKVNLAGQGDFSSTSAVAFHNAKQNVTYLDIDNLPEAPVDKTYQLWSLTLNPLTPTSLGVIEKSESLLRIDNPNATQAFGITLEKAGGSPSPNLEQLYTLGVIDNKG
ncbi:MAG: anti-sigma factor [Nonlabens sp.]